MALSSVIVGATQAHAEVNVIQVTNTNDSGAGSLREALAEAQATGDDEITFAPSVTGTIRLTSGELDVAVGGTSGNLTIEGPGRDVLAVDAGGQSRVLDVKGSGGEVRPEMVVSGLTLTGGAASRDQDPSFSHGGALRATGTDLTLDQVEISGSRAEDHGGGVSVEGGSLLVADAAITGNTAGSPSNSGGGIHVDTAGATGTAVTVRDSIISHNRAGAYGGGMNVFGPAPVSVTRSTVSRNIASYTFSGMEFYVVEGAGGGISADALTVVDSLIAGNEAGRTGGGLRGRSLVVTGSTIADNYGGGIQVPDQSGDEFRMDSSTVTGNRNFGVSLGSDVPAVLRQSTIAGNIGPGVYSNASVALQGTVVAMNVNGDLAGAGSATLSHSLVQDPRDFGYADGGGAILGADPRLSPLADHGGPTPTMLPASNSPVIDQGSGFGATTDQRGFPRPVDDADSPDAADGSDIGAIELTEAELAGAPQVGNIEQPTITGRARVGETLRVDGGTWEPGNVSLTYQWFRNGVPISSATSASYTLTPSDFDRYLYGSGSPVRISVQVTAAIAGHRPGVRVSDYTDYVRAGVVTVSSPAQVTGKLRVGEILRAKPNLRGVSPRRRRAHVTVTWYLDKRLIERSYGASQLELRPRYRGKRVKVVFEYAPPKGYKKLTQVVQRRRPVR